MASLKYFCRKGGKNASAWAVSVMKIHIFTGGSSWTLPVVET